VRVRLHACMHAAFVALLRAGGGSTTWYAYM